MVVQGKDRLHTLPLTLLGRDASTTFRGRVRDQLVYNSESLGFIEGLGFEGLARFLRGCSSANSVDPVADPVYVSACIHAMNRNHTLTCIPLHAGARPKRLAQTRESNGNRHCGPLSADRHWREPRKASRTAQWPWPCL
jgi:hypothetical protein